MKYNPPENLDFSHSKPWPKWRQRFNWYRTAIKLNLESGAVQVCMSPYALSKEVEQVYHVFKGEDNKFDDDYETVLDTGDSRIRPSVPNETMTFDARNQVTKFSRV